MRSLPSLPILLLLAACASVPVRDHGSEARACSEAYAAIDRTVERAEVRDAEAHRVAGFPYLRVSRFLASFRDRTLDDAAFAAWVDRMARLDQEGRAIELRNLPAEARQELDAAIRARVSDQFRSAADVLADCPTVLRQNVLGTADGRKALVAAAGVPDDYSMLARTMGLYPLSAIPVALGYDRWQRWHLPAFEVPIGQEDHAGAPVLFTPNGPERRLGPDEVRAILGRAARNPLRIEEPESEDLRRLAEAFAPALLIDVASAADRIGQPVWRKDGLPAVDPARPVAFVRLAHTWFDGRPALQLVYLFWFDARPRTSVFDLLGGRLDGLIWRVTLGPDGRPVVYDTIHPCGCYHLFFPRPGTRPLPAPENEIGDPRDPILVPANAEVDAPDERALVRVAASSHYVTGVAAAAGHDADARREPYALVIDQQVPDLQLRSMPKPGGGWRSLYGPDGIIRGTERSERVLLWPTGILEPGAMRQWGRHATAFVGRRHFDDPFLIERSFAR